MNALMLLALAAAPCSGVGVVDISKPEAVLTLSPRGKVVVRLPQPASRVVVSRGFTAELDETGTRFELSVRRGSRGTMELSYANGLRSRAIVIEVGEADACEWTIVTPLDLPERERPRGAVEQIALAVLHQPREPSMFRASTRQVRAVAANGSVDAESAVVYRLFDVAYVLIRLRERGGWAFDAVDARGGQVLAAIPGELHLGERWLVVALRLSDQKPNKVSLVLLNETRQAPVEFPEIDLDAE